MAKKANFKDGTEIAGFVTATENRPPRQCGNCKWYAFGQGGSCGHPVVMADPEVPKRKDGSGAVDARDCCDYFQNKK